LDVFDIDRLGDFVFPLIPISKRILTAQDTELVTFYGYFNDTILHEIAHVLGVNYVTLPDGTKVMVNKALKEHYSAIEEAKATIVGLYSIPLLVDRDWISPEKEKEIYILLSESGIITPQKFSF